VIRKARWFTPAVSGVWVQALHDGQTVAVRVSWTDRSQSPDSAWLEFTGKVLGTVVHDDSTPPAPGLWPDQLALQFPLTIPEGFERPFFIMGTTSQPVYQWRWSSTGGTSAGLARGIESFTPKAGAPLAAQAVYTDGQWQVVFTRSLATPDTANELQLRSGRAIPLAVFAWDGSNGETGTRMALSAWYFIALDTPATAGVFVSPLVAGLITLALGMTLVRRAQRANGPVR
jgi:hypothetical protein